jgi:pimeloyl-ACP methyl ester carboxylesterase
LAAAIGNAPAASPDTTATPAHRSATLKPCALKGLDAEASCATYEVLENREAWSGRRIPLKIVVLPALENAKRQPDPLFILAGGPGQAATENAKFFARTFARIHRDRDIVMVDQRGTGESNGLDCDLYGSTVQGHLRDLFPLESIRACLPQWQAHADLRFYTTDIAMADLDEVRDALGYERINLFGTSYGTRAAQVFMRQYPDRVRSVIMKGVTPITVPLTAPMARDAQRAFEILCQDCGGDPQCHTAFPNLKEEFKTVFERLERSVEVELPDAAGKKERVTISRVTIGPTIRSLLQSVEGAATVPMLVHEAFKGDYAPLTNAALTIRRSFPKGVSIGMFLAVCSAEDVPISDEKSIARASEKTFMRDDYFKQLQSAAEILPRKKMSADYNAPVHSEIPTLLISGFLDPATPPSGAEEVARHLPNGLHVIVRYGSHSYGGLAPCVDNIMADFIASGSIKGIDSHCVDKVRRPPFVLKPEAAKAAE